MVECKIDRHDFANDDLSVSDHRGLPRRAKPQNRHFRIVDDRRAEHPAQRSDIGDRKRTATQVVNCKLGRAGLLRNDGERSTNLRDRHPIRTAHVRHDQAPLGVHRYADIDIVFVENLAAFHVEAGVENRMMTQRVANALDDERHRRQTLRPAGRVLVLSAHRVQFRDVRLIHVRHVRNVRHRPHHLVRDGLANLTHALAANRSPLVRVRHAGQRPSRGSRRHRRWRSSRRSACRFHVCLGHPSARSRSRDGVNIHAHLASEFANRGRSGSRRSTRSRSVRRGRLPASGFDCRRWRLRNRVSLRRRRFLGRSSPGITAVALERNHHVADVDRLALFHMNFGCHTRERRRNLNRSLVGLNLEESLVFRDGLALVDQNLDDLGFGDAFSKIGQRKLTRHSVILRCRSAMQNRPACAMRRPRSQQAYEASVSRTACLIRSGFGRNARSLAK